jgi:hypothetical protein
MFSYYLYFSNLGKMHDFIGFEIDDTTLTKLSGMRLNNIKN